MKDWKWKQLSTVTATTSLQKANNTKAAEGDFNMADRRGARCAVVSNAVCELSA